MNSEIQKELRRNRHTLAIVGTGVIVFGVWSVVKTILMLFLRVDDPLVDVADEIPDGMLPYVIFYIMFSVILLAVIGLRLFIGLSARREASGKKEGWFYIVLAFLLAILSASTTAYSFLHPGEDSGAFNDSSVAAVLVDLTSIFTYVELVYTAVRVKKLKRQAKAEASEG